MERKKRNQRHSYFTKEINKVRVYIAQSRSNILALKRKLTRLIDEDRIGNCEEIIRYSDLLNMERYRMNFLVKAIKRYKGFARSASRYEETF